ncbi:hypothetical protein AMAG_06372 [Allomyces macrogynus ATCC 38327]|uniref:C2 domain-containing protein n=1 Tax=Allomyces macrogynus (strain ATCC 38327) TaxID=578462 RepID=A0A0L0SGB5_ALLM3|nr:hypothetical protein AMAG_06372 [Allomyces macrogynus ATCC 38327]|eukprot:KNE61556.1 hypothetical protein AMAG_06372 [Allomyces macrogynus ATCC 38327]
MSDYYPHDRRDEQYSDPYAMRGSDPTRGSVSSISSSTFGRDHHQAPGSGTRDVFGGMSGPQSLGSDGSSGTGRDVPHSAAFQQQPGTFGAPGGYQRPAGAYQQTASMYQQPASAYQQPASAYQQPASVYQQPASAYQQPASAYQQLSGAYQHQQPGMYTSQPSTEFQPMRAPYLAATTGIGGGMVSTDRPVPPARTVMVDILEGRNLPNVELIGKVDPYCLLLAGSDKIKTRVHKDAGTNLTFSDTAELAVASGVDDILLEVWDCNRVRGDKLMGRGRISVADTKIAGRIKDTWVELRDDRGRMAGEVHVKIAPRY